MVDWQGQVLMAVVFTLEVEVVCFRRRLVMALPLASIVGSEAVPSAIGAGIGDGVALDVVSMDWAVWVVASGGTGVVL